MNMRVVQDHFKHNIALGDILLHVVKNRVQYVIVYGIRVNRYGDFILNVHSARQYISGAEYFIYKTHIKSNKGIIKVDKDVPETIKHLLYRQVGKNINTIVSK